MLCINLIVFGRLRMHSAVSAPRGRIPPPSFTIQVVFLLLMESSPPKLLFFPSEAWLISCSLSFSHPKKLTQATTLYAAFFLPLFHVFFSAESNLTVCASRLQSRIRCFAATPFPYRESPTVLLESRSYSFSIKGDSRSLQPRRQRL